MRTQAYFENIADRISEELSRAQSSIVIAVAWFTDALLFEILCKKASEQVIVELLLMNDDINRNSGINYTRLINAGGKVWWFSDKEGHDTLMHNKFCVIDRNIVFNGSYNWTNMARFNHESIIIISGDNDLTADFLLQFQNLKIQNSFEQMLIPYRKGDKWGFYNKKKEIIIPCQYDDASSFSNGLAKVWKNGMCGCIDINNQKIIPCQYEEIWQVLEGFIAIKSNNKWGFISSTGSNITPCLYEDIDYTNRFSEGLISVQLNNKWGFIDKAGHAQIAFNHETIDSFTHWKQTGFFDGIALIRVNNKYGFIDKTGQIIIPCIYDNAGNFSEGLAAVCLNDKWGFIDKTGRVVIKFKYDLDIYGPNVNGFHNGLAVVSLNGKYGFIDKFGDEVIPFKYDYAMGFSEGLAVVYLKQKCGFINQVGQTEIPCIFDSAYPFSEGLAAVRNYEVDLGFIDKTGNEVICCKYHGATWTAFSNNLASISFPDGYNFYIDKEGTEYWED